PDAVRVALPGVGVGEVRNLDGRREYTRVVGHLGEARVAEIRQAEPRGRGAVARHVDGGKARALDEARGDAVVGARNDEPVLGFDETAEVGAATHDGSSLVALTRRRGRGRCDGRARDARTAALPSADAAGARRGSARPGAPWRR